MEKKESGIAKVEESIEEPLQSYDSIIDILLKALSELKFEVSSHKENNTNNFYCIILKEKFSISVHYKPFLIFSYVPNESENKKSQKNGKKYTGIERQNERHQYKSESKFCYCLYSLDIKEFLKELTDESRLEKIKEFLIKSDDFYRKNFL